MNENSDAFFFDNYDPPKRDSAKAIASKRADELESDARAYRFIANAFDTTYHTPEDEIAVYELLNVVIREAR